MMEQKEYIKQRFSNMNEADLWKRMYENPESTFHYHMLLRRNAALDIIKKHPRSCKILDLGCGAGPLLGPLHDASYDIVGVDIAHDMLKNAASSSTTSGGTPNVLQGNTEALPFPDNHFDIIVSLGMFGYVENVPGALKEIKRILKPNGLFVFSVRNMFHGIFFDPCQMLKYIYQVFQSKIITRFQKNTKNNQDVALPVDNAERGFLIDIFDNPYRVIQNVKNNGFEFSEFDGLGYGPAFICGKSILSETKSMVLSRWAESLLRRTKLHCISKWFSDVSMYSFKPGS